MPRIKLIVIEGDLSIEETARLALALGNGAATALPANVKGVEATLRTPEPTPRADPGPTVAGIPSTLLAAPIPTPAEVIQQTLSLDTPEPAPAAPPVPVAAPAQGATTPLTGARKLRDVLEALREQGFTTSEALVAECQRLRAEVPILARIAADQLDERVRRTLEGMV